MRSVVNAIRRAIGLPTSNAVTASGLPDDAAVSLPETPRGCPRVMLMTQPKAGTYLYSEILKGLGIHQTYFHIGKDKLQAYDRALLDDGLANPELFDCMFPLSQSRRLVRSNEFAASHLAPDPDVIPLLQGFKIIAAIRELRKSMLSYTRFVLASGRGSSELSRKLVQEGVCGYIEVRGQWYIERAIAIANWKSQPNALLVRFEDLHADPSGEVERLAQHLESVSSFDYLRIYNDALNARTMTKSTGWEELSWTDEAERAFEKIGGPQANHILGYN
jgi:hypothetical protein